MFNKLKDKMIEKIYYVFQPFFNWLFEPFFDFEEMERIYEQEHQENMVIKNE